MYKIVLASDDAVLLNLSWKFIPALDGSIEVVTSGRDEAFDIIENTSDLDAIVLDENDRERLVSFINTCDRRRIEHPIILVSKDPDVGILTDAVNRNIG